VGGPVFWQTLAQGHGPWQFRSRVTSEPPRRAIEALKVVRSATWLGWALPTLALALVTTRAILAKTGGEAAVPLDDAFIHFEFARSFARLDPLGYGPDGQHVAGATSLLWPMVLAPFHWLGLGGPKIIWGAWALGWASLALLARETHLVAKGLLSPPSALATGAMVFAFAGYVWFAGSGMEVVPFAWLLMRSARRSAEWCEQAEIGAGRPAWLSLMAYAWLSPLMRPEGALASIIIFVALLVFPRARSRAWALGALLGPLAPALVARLFAGQWTTTTAEVKWLLRSPYAAHIWPTIHYYLELFFSTLLDGRVWSAVFVPQGSRVVAWLALPALVVAGWRKRRTWRAAAILAVALGMLLPTTYDSFLVNRLRYLWPFAAAWFVGLGALADELGTLIGRACGRRGSLRTLMAGGFAGALASHLSYGIEDLAVSADAIRSQQVALGLWAREELSRGSRIGLNDAGAITYLSGLPTFDVVGLTTAGEGRYWVSGPGSRFEHYERLGPSRLPTHFIVYPRWMAIPSLLGERLTERTVQGATILGDMSKVAYRASYQALGSAELPLGSEGKGTLVDTLDVADLESEGAHDYQLFFATQAENLALEDETGRVDGGRAGRTLDRFRLELVPGSKLVLRLGGEYASRVEISAEGQALGHVVLSGQNPWEELWVQVPEQLGRGSHEVTVSAAPPGTFTAFHYWCVQ
jgi:hypothetical protein